MNSFDKSVTWIVCTLLIMFFLTIIVLSASNQSHKIEINMDNQTKDAIKYISQMESEHKVEGCLLTEEMLQDLNPDVKVDGDCWRLYE